MVFHTFLFQRRRQEVGTVLRPGAPAGVWLMTRCQVEENLLTEEEEEDGRRSNRLYGDGSERSTPVNAAARQPAPSVSFAGSSPGIPAAAGGPPSGLLSR